jgi:hypothetical protein
LDIRFQEQLESVISGIPDTEPISGMAVTKADLIGFLALIDKAASPEHRMTLVAAGDTALALLDLKAPTEHLDFVGSGPDIAELGRICAMIALGGFQIHTWKDGMVFGYQLPNDYIRTSLHKSDGLSRIDLRALHPLDIVVTRIERLREADMRDIKTCIREFKLSKNQILKRAMALQLVRDESKFERNLDYVLSLFA